MKENGKDVSMTGIRWDEKAREVEDIFVDKKKGGPDYVQSQFSEWVGITTSQGFSVTEIAKIIALGKEKLARRKAVPVSSS